MITGYTTTRTGTVTLVTVTSDLTGTIWYHWYLDGAWIGYTLSGARTFAPAPGERIRVDVVDTNDPDFDALAAPPAGYPARRTLWWVRSVAAGVARYRIQQKKGAGSWVTIAEIPATDAWHYQHTTDRLDDLASYTWRITPLDSVGNGGTALEFGPETIVRVPDAPDFTIAWDADDMTITFDAA